MESLIRENIEKKSIKRKWTDREYLVQDHADVAHKYVKMYCDTKQLPELSFGGPHAKPNGSRVLRKHYHLRFDTKLGNGICVIICIPCAYVACTLIIDKPWISVIP